MPGEIVSWIVRISRHILLTEVKFPGVSVIGSGMLTETMLDVAWRLNTCTD